MGDHHHGRPTGTVSFLFTDIEGSTPLWEQHADAMRAALERHDAIFRQAIQAHGGFVFSTAGDAFSAAFSTPRDAVAAALDAQRALQVEPWPEEANVKVRMGVHLGTVQERDGDYFGSAVNRAARLMGLARGGQVLVSLVVEEAIRDDVPEGVGLKGLGEHALKGLSRPETVFQLTAPDLVGEFPALATATSVPGNLPVPPMSFVGRDAEVAELVDLVGAHRLVTLTGVGGVGKTRLAVEVAAEATPDFADGVWLIELAPVGDPAAVPDAVATAMGIAPQAGLSMTDSIARALSGRRLLMVVDNCEHVLDAAAELVEAVLAGTDSVKIVATSREGLRVGAERLWPVPSLDPDSAAVELFVDRALAVNPNFDPTGPGVAEAMTEVCERLDGIALAIELAAARTVSMNAQDIRDRLDDRFRLLAGSRRGLERHRTLRHAVGWSFDLLEVDERAVLQRCAVFAAGFDLAAATHLCEEVGLDEYAVLDVLDSLVRKSLITVDHHGGHARYGMLETIRQYAEDQLAAEGDLAEVRDRHAAYYAEQAQMYWAIWNGPDQLIALDWVYAEFANLRAGYGWAVDRGDLACGAAIAAHTAMMAWVLMRFEPVEWAEQILDPATGADIAQLPRLHTAASICCCIGRADDAIGHIHQAVALEADTGYEPFEPGWSGFWEIGALFYAGHVDRGLEVTVDLIARPGLAHLLGLTLLLTAAVAAGRAEEAMAVADDALAAARADRNPCQIALALLGAGRAFKQADPHRALRDLNEGLAYTRAHRVLYYEGIIAREAAALEAVHGDLETALGLFDATIDSQFQAGSVTQLAATVAGLALLFDRLDRPEIAATLYGTTTHDNGIAMVDGLPVIVDHLRVTLGDTAFDDCVAAGAAMKPGEPVRYARAQIQAARSQLLAPT